MARKKNNFAGSGAATSRLEKKTRKNIIAGIKTLQRDFILKENIDLTQDSVKLKKILQRGRRVFRHPEAFESELSDVKKLLLEFKKEGKTRIDLRSNRKKLRGELNRLLNKKRKNHDFPKEAVDEHDRIEKIQLVRNVRHFRTYDIYFKPTNQEKYFTSVDDIPFEVATRTISNAFDDLNGQLKFSVKLIVRLNDEVTTPDDWMSSPYQLVTSLEDIPQGYERIRDYFEKRAEMQGTSSAALGLTFRDTRGIQLSIARVDLGGRKAGGKFREKPAWLKTNSVINVDNSKHGKEKCFMYAVLAALYKDRLDKPQRVSGYSQLCDTEEYKILNQETFQQGKETFSYPIEVRRIGYFERKLNCEIVVYEAKSMKEGIVPLKIGSRGKYPRRIFLLLVKDHYMTITNFHALMRPRNTNSMVYRCCYCGHNARSKETFAKHEALCNSEHVLEMPEEGSVVKFKDFMKLHRCPYVIYADYESLMEYDKTSSKTKHTAAAVELKIVGDKANGFNFENTFKYIGPYPERRMVDFLDGIHNMLINDIAKNWYPEPNLTEAEEREFQLAKECWLCHNKFGEDEVKVRDHCHRRGKYRGAAHQGCNLNFNRDARKIQIPIIFHNGKGYDNHFTINAVMRAITQYVDENEDRFVKRKRGENFSGNRECVRKEVISRQVKPIGDSAEKFKEFAYRCYRFRDSYLHLQAPLGVLAKDLSKTELVFTRKALQKLGVKEEDMEGMMKKGIFPYEWFTSHNRLEAEFFPPKEAFYSTLTEKEVSDEEYEFGKKFFYAYCKNMKDYLGIYLSLDVALLADIFEAYRNTSMIENKSIDPAYYISSPSVAYNTFLLQSKVEIALISDLDRFKMFTNGKRGGICNVIRHYAVANNIYLPDFDPTKESVNILYIDANNLYGKAMMMKLPLRDDKSVEPTWENLQKVLDTSLESDTGYQLEIDAYIPEHLHDKFNDYPPMPHKEVMTYDLLSPYAKKIIDKLPGKYRGVEKLHSTLLPKKNYCIHYGLLKSYVRDGLVVTAVHKITSFYQAKFTKDFIEYNTEKRSKAVSPFLKNHFKLMNNSLFGKFLLDPSKLPMFAIVKHDSDEFVKMVSKSNFHRMIPFAEENSDYVTLEMLRKTSTACFANQVGCAILDLSKMIMHDEYVRWKNMYGDRFRLILTDTDSFIFVLTSPDPYFDIEKELKEFHSDFFDFSNYPKGGHMYDKSHQKEPGYFKNEYAGKPIRKVIAVRPKCYLVEYHEGNGGNEKGYEVKVKGINKAGKQKLDVEAFENYVKHGVDKVVNQTTILSSGHEVSTVTREKVVFGDKPDDKRYQIDGIYTNAVGYYKNKY